jgi:hypothetical protein
MQYIMYRYSKCQIFILQCCGSGLSLYSNEEKADPGRQNWALKYGKKKKNLCFEELGGLPNTFVCLCVTNSAFV